MKVKINTLLESKPVKMGNVNLTKQYFEGTDDTGNKGKMYTFGKIEAGQEYEGEIILDTYSETKFTKNKAAYEKQFKSDPEKLESIERQAYTKAAVELLRDFYTLSGNKPVSLQDYKKNVVDIAKYLRNYES